MAFYGDAYEISPATHFYIFFSILFHFERADEDVRKIRIQTSLL